MLYTFCTKYRTDFLHLKRNCIKRNAKVVNFETDKQKSMNELKKIIRLLVIFLLLEN